MKIDDSDVKNKERFPFPASELSNRFIFEVLPDRSWKGKPCFIVGGGPSLRDFDWSLLRGRRVIGVNRVYEEFDPTIIFSMDTRFLRWIIEGKYGPEAVEKFATSKAYKVWLCTYNCKLPEGIFIVKVWKTYSRGFRAFPATMCEGIGHGNNSGYGALNLAACLGASPIYLLGFDMKYKMDEETKKLDEQMKRIGKKIRTHWHEGHPIAHRSNTVKKYIKYFELATMRTREMGLRVVNLNPDSDLPWFPKKAVKEVLH